ncbi:MAG: redoxin domain-containing protein [Deltaproteobacteria bacterium]|nr:redoxin domain-containing protein [Deltaproteobacteria bacterium]
MNRIKLILRILSLAAFVFLTIGDGARALEVGEPAPDFELHSTQGGKLKLSGLRGKNVLIQFYVLDFTPG